jgi:SSS family transporter
MSVHPSLAVLTPRTLTWPDYGMIALYLAVNLAMGWWIRRRARAETRDYFLGGGRVPPWAAAVSSYATAVSSVSYMALPAYTYAYDWLPVGIGVTSSLALMAVGFWFVGILRRLDTTTIFSYLERRFDRSVRLLTAGLAILLKIFGRMSVIMVLPALALSTVTGLNVYLSILLMGVVTTIYAMEGGFEAVVWTDVMQVFVMIGGVFVILGYAAGGVDGGLAGILREGMAHDKFHMVSWEWDFEKATMWVITGSFIASVFTHVSDQPLMQRALAARNVADARRTVVLGSLISLPSTLIFFFVGTALYVFYRSNPDRLVAGLANDSIVPFFIANELPHGIVGLLVAGIFASAMGALSSALNATAAVAVTDFVGVLAPAWTEKKRVAAGHWVTLLCGVAATLMALWVASLGVRSLWEQAVKLISLFGGAFPGLFALGLLTRRANARGAIIGAVASIALTWWIQNYTGISVFFHAFIAFVASVVVGYAASMFPFRSPDQDKLRGLTIWDLS